MIYKINFDGSRIKYGYSSDFNIKKKILVKNIDCHSEKEKLNTICKICNNEIKIFFKFSSF